MPIKVAILNHGYIPHFRVPFYRALIERGNVEYVVFHGAPPSWIGVAELPGPFPFPERRIENHEFRFGPMTLVYQPVVREILTGGYDAIVVTTESKFVSNILLVPLAKLRGIAVLYWGFGYYPRRGFRDSDAAFPVLQAVANFIKNRLTRLADGYLAYTRSGADKLTESGFPADRSYFVQNTIDMTEQYRLHAAVQAADPQQIRRRLGLRPNSVVFVFIGRLVQFKRVDQLIDAVRQINAEGLSSHEVEALIIGSGSLEPQLRDYARDVPTVHFLGGMPPNEEVACCLKVSAAAVVAGLIGLVANHAMAHGRPLITREVEGHGPEIEYIRHDENGLVVKGDVDEFAAVLGRFADSPEWQARLAQGALRSREALRLETMVERFDDAVCATIERRRGGRSGAPAPGRS